MIKGWSWLKDPVNIASFTTISTPSGTSPVATGPSDVLTLIAGSGITITGNAAADSVTIAATGGSGWSLTGNSGTTAGTNFIGTTDAQALVVKTNSIEVGRFASGGGFKLTANNSTIGPLGTNHLTFTNSTGTATTQVFDFAGTNIAALSVGNSGAWDFRTRSNGVFNFGVSSAANVNSGNTNAVQIYNGGLISFGGVFAYGRVSAGAPTVTPTATLTSHGSFGVKGVLVTSQTYTLSDNETIAYVDVNGDACSGTPTNACSTYTNSTDCNAHTEAGCSWFSGNPCSVYDGDQTTCEATSGCTWDASSCTIYDGDQTSCEATPGCTWDGGTNTCSGTFFPGTCSGSYGAACQGTALCSNINDEPTCSAEPGCSWIMGAEITLPADAVAGTTSGQSTTSHLYSIMNISDTGIVKILPNTGQDIQEMTSYTITDKYDEALLNYYKRLGNCSDYSGDQTTCEATAGCSYDTGTDICSGDYTIFNRWFLHNKQKQDDDLLVQVANGTVTNTTTETTLFSTVVGSDEMLANFLHIGKKIDISAFGLYSATGAISLRIRVYLNSTVVLDTGTFNPNSATNELFEISGSITCRTTGATGTVWALGAFQEMSTSHKVKSMTNTSAITIDTTANQTLNITAQWSSASASCSITMSECEVVCR